MMHPLYWEESVKSFEKYKNMDHIDCEAVRILDWMHDPTGVHSKYTSAQEEWFIQNNSISIEKKFPFFPEKKVINFDSTFYFDTGEEITTSTPVNFINSGLTNFNGYKCEIGKREIFVDWRGFVRPGNCSVGGWMGNINEPELIKWPTSPYVCNVNICHCATDVLVNKWI